ncbi:MAG TPA: hypothetical protein VJ742_08015 [Nitrososphaera sp.]|nr:hypothetical protein [Nitrososphaera sp.]
MAKNVIDYINMLADKMLETTNTLPDIQDIDKLIGNMSHDMREKMSIPLGAVFQEGMSSVTAQELEAVRKLREIHLRLAIYQNKLKLVADLAPKNLDTILETVYEMQEVSKKYEDKLDKSEWAAFAKLLQGTQARKLMFDVLQGTGIDDPATVEAVRHLMPPPSPVQPDSKPEGQANEDLSETVDGEFVEDDFLNKQSPSNGHDHKPNNIGYARKEG